MKIRRIIGGFLNEPAPGRIDDVPAAHAKNLIRQGRAVLVPEAGRAEKMIPHRKPERMKSR